MIDDHPLSRRGLAAIVAAEPDMKYCGEFGDGAVPMADLARFRPDLVLINLSMRCGAAITVIKDIRAALPAVRIVALAMYWRKEAFTRGTTAAAHAYVTEIDRLAARVLEAIRTVRNRAPAGVPATSCAGLQRTSGQRFDPITFQIVELIGLGVPTRAIAVRLGLSVRAVRERRQRIRAKFNFPAATQFVSWCVKFAQHRLQRAFVVTVAVQHAMESSGWNTVELPFV